MTHGTPAVELPDHLKRYFWEYDRNRLSWATNRQMIIGRLLEVGGWDAVRWLLANAPEEELKAFLTRRRGRGLDPRRLRFWGLILDLPSDQVDRWIAAQKHNPWHRRVYG